MARRVNIDSGQWFVGADVMLEWPVVEEFTKLPINVSTWAFEFEVRAKPDDTLVLLTVDAADIGTGTSEAGALAGVDDDLVLVPIAAGDTYDESTGDILISGKVFYTLRRKDTGLNVPIAYGDAWVTIVGGR